MIPLFRPPIPRPESWLPYYEESLSCGQLTNFGPNHAAVTKILDSKSSGYFLPVSNGTVAIQVALHTLFDRKAKIAIPDFTFAATANAVVREGMAPVIFPCDPETGQLDLDYLEEWPNDYDGIVYVAPFGHAIPKDSLERLERISIGLGKPVVFDFAGAWPMSVSWGVCCYSLHAAKSLPVGEGGLIQFQTEELREVAKRLIAFDFDSGKAAVSPWGMNGKLDELHCAILRAQLDRKNYLMRRIALRSSLLLEYYEELRDFAAPPPSRIGYPSLCVLRGLRAKEIVDAGARQGIVFRRYYYPLLSDQPGFRKFHVIAAPDARLETYLAFPSDVTQDEFHRVVECARAASQA